MDRLKGQQSKENMMESGKDPVKVILTDEDIPGAKIPPETVEQCSVEQSAVQRS